MLTFAKRDYKCSHRLYLWLVFIADFFIFKTFYIYDVLVVLSCHESIKEPFIGIFKTLLIRRS